MPYLAGPLGSLLLLPYQFTPNGFDDCAGQVLPIDANAELFKLVGTQFGGDGTKDFALPDLREHEPIKNVKYCINTAGEAPK